MANIVMIVGDTGTGKSTSVESLDPKETFIINCLNKPLPFKGSTGMYSQANKNMVAATTSAEIVALMKAVDGQPHIKNLILDDAGFVMSELFFSKALETGYGKFTELALAFQGILKTAKTLRADLNVAVMMHEEDEVSNSIKVSKKIKTVGKLLDDQYNPLSVVSVALFTNVSYDKEGVAQYQFITNRTIVNSQQVPAKSPRGMFSSLMIPNDLSVVFKAAREYYAA